MPIIQLLPEKIMKYWEEIKPYILHSLPPQACSEDNMLNIQESLLIGEMQCWINMNSEEASGLATTKIIKDEGSGTRNLLIYTFYVNLRTSMNAFAEGLESFRKFALAKNCKRIIGYSSSPEVLKVAEKLGADTSWRIISFEI